MANQDRISVIIPAHNSAKTIKRCLNSILRQTEDGDEIIIIDDGSSDNTKDICKDFSKLNEAISVYSQKQSGVSAARNKGLSFATREWVLFVDSDDSLCNDAIETLRSEITPNVDLIIGSRITYRGDNVINLPNNSRCLADTEDLKRLLCKSVFYNYSGLNYYSGMSFATGRLYRLSTINSYKLAFDESMAYYEDALFSLEFISKANGVLALDKHVYNYCLNDSSITQSFNENCIQDYCRSYHKLVSEKNNLGLYDTADIYYMAVKDLTQILKNYARFCHKAKLPRKAMRNMVSRLMSSHYFAKAANNVKVSMLPKLGRVTISLAKRHCYSALSCVYLLKERKGNS